MKIRTKVRAGRACGPFPAPTPSPTIDIAVWSLLTLVVTTNKELDMKIRTKVRAGRACGPLPTPGPILIDASI